MDYEQKKHIANSLRVIGMAQFASYGYVALKLNNWLDVILSAIIYLAIEGLAVLLLKRRN